PQRINTYTQPLEMSMNVADSAVVKSNCENAKQELMGLGTQMLISQYVPAQPDATREQDAAFAGPNPLPSGKGFPGIATKDLDAFLLNFFSVVIRREGAACIKQTEDLGLPLSDGKWAGP